MNLVNKHTLFQHGKFDVTYIDKQFSYNSRKILIGNLHSSKTTIKGFAFIRWLESLF